LPSAHEPRLGLFGATSVGVGAIVGGGILALAGVAFATTGPSAIIAFAINGVIAMLTALTFAEMASKFPESGGTYTFSKKVLSVEAAFTVGWVVWFASVVAAVLYAMGFAYFALVFASDLLGANAPAWFEARWLPPVVAIVATLAIGWGLIRRSGGGGNWANIGKVIVFGVLVLCGLWAVGRQPAGETGAAFSPFFKNGMSGLVQAMGYTFIALQGFDLIAAVGGEVRNPAKVLPRAMILSLGIALLIYIPLLFVVTAIGTGAGLSISEAAAANPEGIVAEVARQYLGSFGYWLVIVAAVLSMYSALQANLFAASRIAAAMATDRTLPAAMAVLNSKRNPVTAVVVTACLVSLIILVVPDVSAAGAASSLIFLITFALAHWIAIQVRRRSILTPPPFRTPWFPLIPVAGGLACIGLAIFQGVVVPSAGIVAIAWLGIGGVLFIVLFASRARIRDTTASAVNPELMTLRGRSRLVLVPIANPASTEPLVSLASALVPIGSGRVVLQNIVVAGEDWDPLTDPAPMDRSQEVMRQVLTATARMKVHVEALTSVAARPMSEIARVATLHQFQSVVMGLNSLADKDADSALQRLLGVISADVVVLRSRVDWKLASAAKILVPLAGRGRNLVLLARLLGSLSRDAAREITFLRVMPTSSRESDVRREEKSLRQLGGDLMDSNFLVNMVRSDDPTGAIAAVAKEFDLLILGAQRMGRRQRVFGEFIKMIAAQTDCPMIVISSRV